MGPPEAPKSQEHLQRIEALIGEARAAAPDAAFFITADHGMKFKTRCCDLARVCEAAGTPIRFMLSPERDYYIQHHKNYSGCAWLWLRDPNDYPRVEASLCALPGGLLPSEEPPSAFIYRWSASAIWWSWAIATPCSARWKARMPISIRATARTARCTRWMSLS